MFESETLWVLLEYTGCITKYFYRSHVLNSLSREIMFKTWYSPDVHHEFPRWAIIYRDVFCFIFDINVNKEAFFVLDVLFHLERKRALSWTLTKSFEFLKKNMQNVYKWRTVSVLQLKGLFFISLVKDLLKTWNIQNIC